MQTGVCHAPTHTGQMDFRSILCATAMDKKTGPRYLPRLKTLSDASHSFTRSEWGNRENWRAP
jgi:hypothetical protein